jgi:hypothetical protein
MRMDSQTEVLLQKANKAPEKDVSSFAALRGLTYTVLITRSPEYFFTNHVKIHIFATNHIRLNT